jgi:hypothetical protein
LWVVSVSNPEHPVGHCDTPGEANGVAVSGTNAYVADGSGGLRVISVSNPAYPAEVGYCGAPADVYGVAVSKGYAYVAGGAAGLRVVSVFDPAHPTEVGYYDTPGVAHDVALSGDYVYVADGSAGLQIYQFYGVGVEESPKPQASSRKLSATVIRNLPVGTVAFDAMGRRVLEPKSGVFFVRSEPSAESRRPLAVTKVVITR